MTYYYNPKTGQYAKLLSNKAGLAVVVINDKALTIAWHDFIREFKRLGVGK